MFNKEIKPIFNGEIRGGALVLFNQQRFNDYLKTLTGEVEVVVSRRGRPRTNKQNRWYWGVAVKMIAEYAHEDPEKIHEFLKGEFCIQDIVVIKLKNGSEVTRKIPMSTTQLLTTGFNKYKGDIQSWAREFLGLIIPDPEQVDL